MLYIVKIIVKNIKVHGLLDKFKVRAAGARDTIYSKYSICRPINSFFPLHFFRLRIIHFNLGLIQKKKMMKKRISVNVPITPPSASDLGT